MKGNTTIKLLAALGILVVVYLVMTLTKGDDRSKSFRSVLVEIDTAQVTRIEVVNAGSETVVTKKGADTWEVGVEDGTKPARTSAVKNLLTTIEGAVPSRLVSRSRDRWKDYAVDSTGTRVKVFEGNDMTLDLVIGRFGVEGQQQFHTFVRLAEDDDVYQADNFMGISIAKAPEDFRNSDVLRLRRDSLVEVSFNYIDSAFSLYKEGDNWKSSTIAADSASVASYLQGLSFVTSRNFAEGDGLGTPTLNVTFGFTDSPEIQLSAYQRADGWILQSTENTDEYFEDEEVFEKIFQGPSQLAAGQ